MSGPPRWNVCQRFLPRMVPSPSGSASGGEGAGAALAGAFLTLWVCYLFGRNWGNRRTGLLAVLVLFGFSKIEKIYLERRKK